MGRLADHSCRFLSLFAVSLRRGRVGLGLFMLALLVVMGRLHVMMGCYVVVSGRLKVLLDCFGLGLGSHVGILSEKHADREATLPQSGQLNRANDREWSQARQVMPCLPSFVGAQRSDTHECPQIDRCPPRFADQPRHENCDLFLVLTKTKEP